MTSVVNRPPRIGVPPRTGVAARVVGLVTGTASTTPGRLWRVELVLVVACVVLAVFGVFGGASRGAAVHEGSTRLAGLNVTASDLYQSLADADASATTGYVSGGLEPAAVRARYDADVQRAGQQLVTAAGLLPPADPAIAAVSTVGAELPVYTALIENARAFNRLGYPLGQSYLGDASSLMRTTILPAVEQVRAAAADALAASYHRGGGIPFAVLAIGLAVLFSLLDLLLRERRRTNRLINAGLLLAGVAMLGLVVWWGAAVFAADARLDDARAHSDARAALDDARIAVLQARSNESLVLVARNAGDGGFSDKDFGALVVRVRGADGLLDAAASADPGIGREVQTLRATADAWNLAHTTMRLLDDGGRYPEAVASVVGRASNTSGGAFDALDAELATAIAGERDAVAGAVGSADAALAPLAWVSAVLALLAAVAVVFGIGQRLGEYR